MNTMIKRFAAVMSAGVLAVGCFTVGELTGAKQFTEVTAAQKTTAYNGTCGENVRWTLDKDSGTLTISGKGDMTDYNWYGRCRAEPPVNTPWYDMKDSIKKVIITGRVTSVGRFAFERCKNIESAVLPDSIKTIGEYAFQECKKLKTVNIPKNTDVIEQYAFQGCESIEKLTIPDSVKTIHEWAFQGCKKLSGLTLENGIEKIEHTAFNDCDSLTSVDIPASVENFTYAFTGNINMTDINVSKDNPYWTSVDGVVFSKDMTKLWEYPRGKNAKSYSVPEGVKFIGCNAIVANEKLEEVKLPESVTYLTGCVFRCMNGFKNVTVPENIMSIGWTAYYECNNLETITILNPKCDIYDDCGTIANCHVKVGEYGSNPSFSGTIIGYEGSTAQAYAEKYNYKFKSLGKYKDNGALKRELYNFTSDYLGGRVHEISDNALDELDVNSDGKINVFDLIIMKRGLQDK